MEAQGTSQAGLLVPSLSAASTGGFNRAREPSTKTPRIYCRRPSLEIIIPASTYGKCLELDLLCKQPDGNLESDCGCFSSSSSLQQRSAPRPLCPGLVVLGLGAFLGGSAVCQVGAEGCIKERSGCETTPEVPGRNAKSNEPAHNAGSTSSKMGTCPSSLHAAVPPCSDVSWARCYQTGWSFAKTNRRWPNQWLLPAQLCDLSLFLSLLTQLGQGIWPEIFLMVGQG